MPLAKLKEIEADILNKNPDLENRLNLYHEEEKKLTKLKEEYPSIQNRINEIIGTALKRKEQEYAVAGTLKKFFIDRTSPNFTEPEKTEIERPALFQPIIFRLLRIIECILIYLRVTSLASNRAERLTRVST